MSKETDYLQQRFDDHFKEVKDNLVEIKLQVMKTNGRVTSLEKSKYFMLGGLAIVSMLVIPLVVYIFTHSIK